MESIILFLFIFGTIFGSFYNVLIDRLPLGVSPFKGRSHCDNCKHILGPFDLFPVFSYLLLRGKCRYCHHPISIQNPIIEISTGCLFVGTYFYVLSRITDFATSAHFLLALLSLLIVFSSFLIIFVIDLKHRIIPDELIISTLIGVIIYSSTFPITLISVVMRLLGAGVGLLPFLSLYLLTKGKGMGFGDVKLGPVLGLFLSFPLVLVGLYLSFLTGGLISIILLVVHVKEWGQKIAFGPFLITGTLLALIAGEQIIRWYSQFL